MLAAEVVILRVEAEVGWVVLHLEVHGKVVGVHQCQLEGLTAPQLGVPPEVSQHILIDIYQYE